MMSIWNEGLIRKKINFKLQVSRYKKMFFRSLFVMILFLDIVFIFMCHPGDIFLKKSSRFTLEKFKKLKNGEHISNVIEILGEPVKIEKLDENCDAYNFCCPYSFFEGGLECWVLVDDNGYIFDKYLEK